MDLREKQFFSGLRQGDENAFEMIFKTYYKPLCNYAYTFLNDKDEAEEVVQSTFISIWDKRQSIDVQTSLKSYLYRMVRNTCLNVIKHVKVKNEHVRHEMAVADRMHEGASQSVLSSELEQRIHEAMKVLPDQCRTVFQMSRFEELKYAEIAKELSISVKTVENHMGKALKIMRVQLKDYLPLLLILFKDWII